MEILELKGKSPPSHKCRECKSKLKVDFTEDCYISVSESGSFNYYADCPVCGASVFYYHLMRRY